MHFLSDQNIFFFTLYNQLPIEFLPLPHYKYYLNFPLITFINKSTKYYSYSQIKLNELYIDNEEIIDADFLWTSRMINDPKSTQTKSKIIKDYILNIQENKNDDIYDNFYIYFDTNYLLLLPDNYLSNKMLFIFTNEPIISDNFVFIKKNKIFILYNCYIKNKNLKYKKISKKIIHINSIKFISIYSYIDNKKLLECFSMNILPKNTYLYNSTNVDYIEDAKKYDPLYFTITPFVRIYDPLYVYPEKKYIYKEYITNKDLNVLNMTTNIYLNNILINQNYSKTNELLYCFNNFANLKYCNCNFINSEKIIININYNKKIHLLILIWKNKKYVDFKITYNWFLDIFKIDNFFNFFDFIKLKNNKIQLLGEELFINDSKNISLVTDMTDDMTQFKIYDQKNKYKDTYYKPI